jgi:WhiB family redox-sensing transcriptional regulator
MSTRPSLQWSEGAAGPFLATLADEDRNDWWRFAACAEIGGDIWHPEKGGSTRDAKSVCRSCPVVAECLEYALANDEKFGIWGAKSERERRRLKRSGTGIAAVAAAKDGNKTCSSCRVPKPLDKFWRDAHSSDGRKYACITCLSAAQSRRASRAA